jgi:hypothetical protein
MAPLVSSSELEELGESEEPSVPLGRVPLMTTVLVPLTFLMSATVLFFSISSMVVVFLVSSQPQALYCSQKQSTGRVSFRVPLR